MRAQSGSGVERTSWLARYDVVAIAEHAGLKLAGWGVKRTLRCPFHDDRRPSAYLSLVGNFFHCSRCQVTLGGKRFAERLGVDLSLATPSRMGSSTRLPATPRVRSPLFPPNDANRAWRKALIRVRTDDSRVIKEDAEVYGFLQRRGLQESWDPPRYGILSPDPAELHPGLRFFLRGGHRIIVPLYDQRAELVSLQGRAVRHLSDGVSKILFPAGAVGSGTVFANDYGLLALLSQHPGPIILGEGLTDHLALSIAAPGPVLCAPGVGMTAKAIGPWARGKRVVIAVDADCAGDRSLSRIVAALEENGARPCRLRCPKGCGDACDALNHCHDQFLFTLEKIYEHG